MGKEIINLFLFVFLIVVGLGTAFNYVKKKHLDTMSGSYVAYPKDFSPEQVDAKKDRMMEDYDRQMEDYKRQQETSMQNSREQQKRMMEDQKRQMEDLRRQTQGY